MEEAVVNLVYVGGCVFLRIFIIIFLPVLGSGEKDRFPRTDEIFYCFRAKDTAFMLPRPHPETMKKKIKVGKSPTSCKF